MSRRRRAGARAGLWVLASLAAVCLWASPAAAAEPPSAASAAWPEAAPGTAPLTPSAARAFVTEVVRRAPLRRRFGGPITGALATTTSRSRGPVRLLVLEGRTDDRGRRWLRVLLPGRPNGRDGWIRATAATLEVTAWRVRVLLAARRVQLLRAGRVVASWRAVVGAPGTPTPRGRFALYETARQSDPRGFLGPFALHLTARSEVLDDFGGGPGTVALHGRGPSALGDPLGSARSHGCVRLDSRVIRRLARTIGPGTPVEVR